MGNASSTPQPGAKPNNSFHRRFPSRPPQESARPKSPSSQNTQKPLRNKKRSLELPDLASLGLGITPSNSGNSAQRERGRTTHSSPINIPVSPHLGGKARQRPQNNTSYSNIESEDDLLEYKDPQPERRERGRQPRAVSRDQPPAKLAAQIVNSTITTGLRKPSTTPSTRLEEGSPLVPAGRRSTGDEGPPCGIRVYWRGGGEHVLLARAGDDDWKGRTLMHKDPNTGHYIVDVDLLPGTHHMRFLVDGVWRIDETQPTAVDEQGSLANYLAVGLTVFNPQSPVSSSPPPRPIARSLPAGSSFWVETPSGSSTNLSAESNSPPQRVLHPYESGKWTSVIPPQLMAAAKEEEAWIAANEAAQASGSRHRDRNPPALPPAPALPRHLEKLILNVRSPGVSTPRPAGSPVGARRSADSNSHNRSSARSLRRSTLGMNTMDVEADSPSTETPPPKTIIPVTTASGTDVSRAGLESLMTPLSPVPYPNERSERERQEREKVDKLAERAQYEPGLADDSSMLPVPNHVVLHHLSTSAIKNGLLAVASTNRYRKKYLTTVYYKPTDT